ncbi:hypothetical protein, partial [Pseudomonas laurylsulfatiphila]|uniref:hypothetical protein n=1 Tax=Pseudomonas laurylsulfatiphila TaxID=2011015 RepID=UPI003D0B2CB5
FPSLHIHPQNLFCNTKKILLLINYFNFRTQPPVLIQVIGQFHVPDSRYPSANDPKSQFCKGFPLIRALTVWWAHSYSVRKWRKVA